VAGRLFSRVGARVVARCQRPNLLMLLLLHLPLMMPAVLAPLSLLFPWRRCWAGSS
jgi:hypothetical protein